MRGTKVAMKGAAASSPETTEQGQEGASVSCELIALDAAASVVSADVTKLDGIFTSKENQNVLSGGGVGAMRRRDSKSNITPGLQKSPKKKKKGF